MDKLIIEDLRTRCVVGINEDERREKQDVTINITVFCDLRKACKTDKFEDTVDYRNLKKRILSLVENSSFFLLEALAEAVANACLSTSGVKKTIVRVDKPSALRFAKSVGVIIERDNHNEFE